MKKELDEYIGKVIFSNILMLFSIVLMFVVSWEQIKNDKIELQERLIRIEQEIEHRSKLDSMYWNHLEQCAFQLKKEYKFDTHN